MTRTNRVIADMLGLTESAVSRLRSGRRRPSDGTLKVVESTMGWDIQDQLLHRLRGTWAREFETRVTSLPTSDAVVFDA